MKTIKSLLFGSMVVFAMAAQAQTIMIRGATVHTMAGCLPGAMDSGTEIYR